MKLKLFILFVFLNVNTIFAQIDRTVLPIQAPVFKGKIDSTYKTSQSHWAPFLPARAPEGAPNVVVIMLDDLGYGQLGCYGSAIETPNIDKLAKNGLTYTNFHSTPLCTPSRAALLTGRNSHSIGMNILTEAATGYPNSNGRIPPSAALISDVLRLNGYNTMALGKWHLTPYMDRTAAGPYTHWPLGMGFERFYGFLGGEMNHYIPFLTEDNRAIDVPTKKDYHLSEDLVDKTIRFIKDQQNAHSGRPFFTYLAFGAVHAPLHTPKTYIQKYKGRFDKGWDIVRKETFDRQKKMGIIPQNAVLPDLDQGVDEWDKLSADQKKLYARFQEVFAGFLDHTDVQIGRLFSALENMNLSDNTIILIMSDNGASQEGSQNGSNVSDRYRNLLPETLEDLMPHIDKLGTSQSLTLYPYGWAMAGNTPFKRWKQDTHAGGTTTPLIVSYPNRIKDKGSKRHQYHHLIDIVPTLLELSEIPEPKQVNGIPQMPLHGVSMAYTFDNPNEKTRKVKQYYEMFGKKSIWADGWNAVSYHKRGDDYRNDKWELYDVQEDFTESKNLADRNPQKLKEMVDLWWQEGKSYGVLPLDDRLFERVNEPNRPQIAIDKDVYTLYPNTSQMQPNFFGFLSNSSHTVTAFVNIPKKGADGVLASEGYEQCGWSFYVKNGKLNYAHNFLKIKEYHIESTQKLSPGQHRLTFRYMLKERLPRPLTTKGDIELFIDDKPAGILKDVTMARIYGIGFGAGFCVGSNVGAAITKQYQTPFDYKGILEKVTVEFK